MGFTVEVNACIRDQVLSNFTNVQNTWHFNYQTVHTLERDLQATYVL